MKEPVVNTRRIGKCTNTQSVPSKGCKEEHQHPHKRSTSAPFFLDWSYNSNE
jgi:hypothetical protein